MNFYLLFLESLGTPELILIAFVTLIVFGPRKLPSIGRTIGKYTSEFKRASNEFRRNWEYEVEAAEREDKFKATVDAQGTINDAPIFTTTENTIGRTSARRRSADENSFDGVVEQSPLAPPEIRAVEQKNFQADFQYDSAASVNRQTDDSAAHQVAAPPRKREWL